MRAIGLRFRPRENRRRTRQVNSGISCSLHTTNKFSITIITTFISNFKLLLKNVVLQQGTGVIFLVLETHIVTSGTLDRSVLQFLKC